MKIVSVILDIPTQSLEEAFTYAVPSGYDDVEVGCAVLVPFGQRRAIGFVVGIDVVDDMETFEQRFGFPPSKLKPFHKTVSKPFFDEDGAACAQFLAKRYLAPLSNCIRLFTPPGGVGRVVKVGDEWELEPPKTSQVDDRWVSLTQEGRDFQPKKSAVKQVAVIQALSAGELRVAELTHEYGAVSQVLTSLEAKGVVRIEQRRRMRGSDELSNTPASVSFAQVPIGFPHLTEGQGLALETIETCRKRGDGEVVLVDGVTGSGKTEVYLRAIEHVLDDGMNAIVLVPEISLTPQTVGRFRGRFGDRVAVMHSRMSSGERYDQWDFIRSGDARVVVGARSALFTPVENLGLIVIDEEHESSYKQDSAPRYVTRDVAVWMANRHGCPLVLGSATPSIEALESCRTDSAWHHVVLPERANRKAMPKVQIVDMANEFHAGSRSMFSTKLSKSLEETLRSGHKAILMLNQRGFAKFLLCRDCGFVPECPSCSTSLTYHERGNLLMCHHCGHRETAPAVCPECGSPYLKKFGAGTQRVESDLRVLIDSFEGVQADIIRMDADTTKGKGAHRKLLERFMAADAAVLLGTQMIAKGLDFDDVTLVGVINADTMLKLPDFRSGERTFDLIEQVAGRAGRADLPGTVIVQTYWPESPAIRAAARYDRQLFLDDELPKRRMLSYPPYSRMANILIWGKQEEAVRSTALRLSDDLATLVRDMGGDSWDLLPATPCVLSKLQGTYRWHLLLRCPVSDDPARLLHPYFAARTPEADVRVTVDIDPTSIL